MGNLSIAGVGSGLDLESIIGVLLKAETDPARNRLNAQESKLSTQLSAIGNLKSSLASFVSAVDKLKAPAAFSLRKVNLSETGFITATATSSATEGNFNIAVNQLAKGTTAENTFADSSSALNASGDLTFDAGAGVDAFTISIDAGDSLQAVRTKINSATGNFGVSANIVNTGSGAKLIITSTVTGAGNDLTITQGGSPSNLDQLSTNLTQTQAAQDASATIGTDTVTSSTNLFENIIQDVSFTALKVTTAPINLAIEKDVEGIKTNVESFVTAFNNLAKTIKNLTSTDKNKPGALLGDATLRIIEGKIRSAIGSVVPEAVGPERSLAEIGITLKSNGELAIDNTKIDSLLAGNLDKIGSIFGGANGVATVLSNSLTDFSKFGGILAERETSLNDQISKIATERSRLDFRAEQIEARLRRQFAALDALVAQNNSTMSFLTQRFSASST